MIWSIAWKNLWRNRNRSLVVIVAVTLGIISGVLLVGIMKGWVEQRVHDAIYNEMSHLQIHNTEYLKNEEILLTVTDTSELFRAVEALPSAAVWVRRTKIFAMVNTPWANSGFVINGIHPEKEKKVTEIYKNIVPGGGEYLKAGNHGEILISDKSAELLKLKQYIITEKILNNLKDENIPVKIITQLENLKDRRFRSQKDFREALREQFNKKELDRYGLKIIDKALDYRLRNKIQVTISDIAGAPVQGTFRVCGIFKTRNGGFDQANAYINSGDLADLYGGEVYTHEIAIMLKDTENMDQVKEYLTGISAGNSVNTWEELAPDAAMMNDYMVIYYFIFIGIIMLALAFGIINTMMMAILERTKEIGMLMAIGMNRIKVFSMIMTETIFLTIVGAIIGMLSGWLIIELLGKSGIHFSSWGEGFEAIGFSAVVYPVISADFFLFIIILVIVTAIISSIWPARKALALNPVEALRTE